MVTVELVKTKKQQKEFLNFPLNLYEGNPCFVPPLYGDEKRIFRKDYVYSDTCDSVFFNAYEDGKIVGRISGIIQRAANEKNHEKRCRFTRFDAIDSQEVATKLFGAVENWAVEKGMDTMCGPLGYSDLEREGLLIDGFDQISTFEEQYNADYYQKLIENLGYQKEVDWNEYTVRPTNVPNEKLEEMVNYVMQRYHLHWGPAKNTNDFLKRYKDEFFALLDESYDQIYGTVPFTENMKKMMIDNFRLIIDMRFVAVILNEKDEVVALGICFPAIGKAVQKSKGHLTPAALVRVLKTIKHPEVIDLGLIGVKKELINSGAAAVMAFGLDKMLREGKVEHAETNLNLENNAAIINLWKRFDAKQHKKRRAFVKKLK